MAAAVFIRAGWSSARAGRQRWKLGAVSSRRGRLQHAPAEPVLKILVLLIDKPGHRHQAEGGALSIARITPVERVPVEVRPRWFAPPALRRAALTLARVASPAVMLRLVYGIDPAAIDRPEVIVGSGRPAVTPGILLARHFGVPFVFAGLADGMAEAVEIDLMLVSVKRFESATNAIFTPVPSLVAPDLLPPPRDAADPRGLAGASIGLLLGGDAHSHRFDEGDWRDLARLVRETRERAGVRWWVTNSRRTGDVGSRIFEDLAGEGVVERFVDWRRPGSGTVAEIFAADLLMVTEDSVSMMSEAVAAQRRVVTMRPRDFEPTLVDDIVATLTDGGAMAVLPIAGSGAEDLLGAFGRLTPVATDHRDTIAAAVRSRLPGLFAADGEAR